MKKRKCFVKGGFIYVHQELVSDIVTWHYADFLKAKMEKTAADVATILAEDKGNQLSTFLTTTLTTLNEANVREDEQ